jgi:hypothetical protein
MIGSSAVWDRFMQYDLRRDRETHTKVCRSSRRTSAKLKLDLALQRSTTSWLGTGFARAEFPRRVYERLDPDL